MSDISTWLENSKQQKLRQLNEDLNVDVAIIGGGITGITAAFLLSKQKKRVVVVDKDGISQGATGWTTAIITQYIDTDLKTLVENYDKKTAQLVWQSGKDALDFIRKTVQKENIDCEFVAVPYYVYATSDHEFDNIKQEFEASQKLTSNLTLSHDNTLPIKAHGVLTLPNQAKFHPVKYVSSLAQEAIKNGVSIYQAEVKEIKDQKVITKSGTIKAKDIIVATHLPFNEPHGLKFKKTKYKTYMLEVKLPTGTLPEACYQDLKSPYHYMRVDKRKGQDRILVGGEDHRRDIPVSEEKSFKALEKYFKNLLPKVKYTITNQWAGSVIETIDGLPYIGAFRDNPHHHYATGFSGNGMTYGTLSAMMLTDKIMGRKNEYEKIYRPDRKPTVSQLASKFADYAKVFLGGVVKNSLSR
jgi:glycine/D-amino acid oxidase-like deaminating enzyme